MSTTPTAQPVELPEPESIRETFESIVIALILAFVFRAFIVEAFVIPTGSMAPTLYGAHGTILCEDCGVEFGYGVRDLSDHRRSSRQVGNYSKATCPNCNHENSNLAVSDERRNPEKGDRILVLKWPLDMGIEALEPRRWEVTVFKDPSDGTTNFIKRLVGLPGEVIMILDGNVYAVPIDNLSEEAFADLDAIRHQKFLLRSGKAQGVLRSPSPSTMAELDEKMKIQRKNSSVQQSLWHTVYDHDYPPFTRDADQPFWKRAQADRSGWDTSTRRVRFQDRSLSDDYIVLSGKQIRASCAYNIKPRLAEPVSDLRTSFVITPKDATTTVHVRLEKLGRVFWATIGMDGTVALIESRSVPGPDTPVMARTKVDSLVAGKSVEVSFENVDYRLGIYIAGEKVLSSSDDPNSESFYAPLLKSLRKLRSRPTAPPRIYAEGGAFELTHLVVDRDEHYYHDANRNAVRLLPWAPPRGWASAEHPLLLRDREYFMLGDNTAASKDSRLWDEMGPHLAGRGEAFQLGTVPRDQLIGQAFFVYWPSGHSISWLPSIGAWRWNVIPDVGRMRWIR